MVLRKNTINIVHNTTGVGQTSFGLGQVALNLALKQNELGCDAKVWCVSSANEVHWAYASSNISEGRIIRFLTIGPPSLAFSPAMMHAAKAEGGIVDIVHQHGIWTFISYVTRVFRRRHNTPYVVAPHGSLETWALRRSSWKKSLALHGYERANMFEANCIHAVSEAEISDIRNFGLTCPIAFIPNGVSAQWLDSRGNAGSFREALRVPDDRRILLFLSRITPKKGLLTLVRAIHAIKNKFADWILVIAGIDEFGHKKEVERLVERLNLNDLVKLIGPLYDQGKRDAFAAAELFILPSYSEGAPVVILESLAAGIPVITTKASPWQELNGYSCGWWTDISVESITDALCDATSLSSDQLKTMGKRGHDLVNSRYAWADSAKKTLYLYEWLLGHRQMPDFVVD